MDLPLVDNTARTISHSFPPVTIIAELDNLIMKRYHHPHSCTWFLLGSSGVSYQNYDYISEEWIPVTTIRPLVFSKKLHLLDTDSVSIYVKNNCLIIDHYDHHTTYWWYYYRQSPRVVIKSDHGISTIELSPLDVITSNVINDLSPVPLKQ